MKTPKKIYKTFLSVFLPNTLYNKNINQSEITMKNVFWIHIIEQNNFRKYRQFCSIYWSEEGKKYFRKIGRRNQEICQLTKWIEWSSSSRKFQTRQIILEKKHSTQEECICQKDSGAQTGFQRVLFESHTSPELPEFKFHRVQKNSEKTR